MEDFVALVLGDLTELTFVSGFTCIIRLLALCIVIEGFGVILSHISSLGR